jgi:metallo-beta-lactamase family protein
VKEGWDKWLPGLTYTQSPEESMALNRISDGAIIIAGSGMCTGGRILHHLKHNLWHKKNHVVIVGYQAIGTLGRALVDGVPMVKIFGDEIAVKAQVHTLGGFSAHAGQDQLIDWASHFRSPRPRMFLVHGELDAMQSLQQRFVREYQWDAYIPSMGEVITL